MNESSDGARRRREGVGRPGRRSSSAPDPVDPEAPKSAGPVAERVEVPVAVERDDLDRVDPALGHLVARARVVLDVGRPPRLHQRAAPRRGAAAPGRSTIRALAGAEHRLELGERPGRATRRRRHPGTARIVRAAAARAKPSAGVRRRGRAIASGRNASTEWSVTTISMSASGEYGGHPAAGGQLELAHELVLAQAEALAPPPRSARRRPWPASRRWPCRRRSR